MNIILVIFDSLRKDCLGAYGSPPWGKVYTPNFNTFAEQSLVMDKVYPESLPTLPARRALYTGKRVYPFHNADYNLKGDFHGAPGWGPIPEEQPTLAERLQAIGYRTGLIADVYHMFKPSKNFWRGFDQWLFLRGQEVDPHRSGPKLTPEEIDYWIPKSMQNELTVNFVNQCLMNMHNRNQEESYFSPRIFKEASLWLEQNRDADNFFLTIESFDPHEPWLIPAHYREIYNKDKGPEIIHSFYGDVSDMAPCLLKRLQDNYRGLVTLCDRWFGYFMESCRVLGLLENTMIIFTTDHGHSIGDNGYLGKRGYPSAPEVYNVPLMIRHPQGKGAGQRNDMIIQHTDISATILDLADLNPVPQLDGKSFMEQALAGEQSFRDHVTVGWGTAVTVINKKWWLNCKINGKGPFLYNLEAENPFAINLADKKPETVKQLFALAQADAENGFPDWLMDMAENELDAPGCSNLAVR